MEITLNLEKRTLLAFILVTVFFASLLFVRAFNSGGPASYVGHSAEEGGVPTGAVMFFNLSTCPTGYADATSVSGRSIVGMPAAGTLEGTTGTALTNLENRAVGAHAHGVSDPGHGHGVSDPGHSHSAISSVSDPGHFHSVGAGGALGAPVVAAASIFTPPVGTFSSGSSTTGIGVSTTVSGAFTSISISSSGTGISVSSAGAVAGTNSPYVQYLACVKI